MKKQTYHELNREQIDQTRRDSYNQNKDNVKERKREYMGKTRIKLNGKDQNAMKETKISSMNCVDQNSSVQSFEYLLHISTRKCRMRCMTSIEAVDVTYETKPGETPFHAKVVGQNETVNEEHTTEEVKPGPKAKALQRTKKEVELAG